MLLNHTSEQKYSPETGTVVLKSGKKGGKKKPLNGYTERKQFFRLI